MKSIRVWETIGRSLQKQHIHLIWVRRQQYPVWEIYPEAFLIRNSPGQKGEACTWKSSEIWSTLNRRITGTNWWKIMKNIFPLSFQRKIEYMRAHRGCLISSVDLSWTVKASQPQVPSSDYKATHLVTFNFHVYSILHTFLLSSKPSWQNNMEWRKNWDLNSYSTNHWIYVFQQVP